MPVFIPRGADLVSEEKFLENVELELEMLFGRVKNGSRKIGLQKIAGS